MVLLFHPLSAHSLLSPCEPSLGFLSLWCIIFCSSIIAQSHCWGAGGNPFCTRRQNIRDMRNLKKKSIKFISIFGLYKAFFSDLYSSHNACESCRWWRMRQRCRVLPNCTHFPSRWRSGVHGQRSQLLPDLQECGSHH